MGALITVGDGLIEKQTYDQLEDKMVVETIYDNSDIIKDNLEAQATQSSFGRYKGNLVKVGSLHMGDVTRLKNLGYDVLSPDPAEVRRALCYIQSNEPQLLLTAGKPFALHRNKWQ